MDSLGVYSLNRMPKINGGSTVSRLKPVFYRCGRRGRIQYYCNFNRSNEVFHKERKVLHHVTQSTYR